MATYDRLRRLRRLAVVPRWTVVPTIRQQSVAEHSFHVAWIVGHLAALYNLQLEAEDAPVDVADLVACAIIHDESEALSGDIATPYKRHEIGAAIKQFEADQELGVSEELTGASRNLLKAADLIEAYLFVQEEIRMGNTCLEGVRADLKCNLSRVWHELHVFRRAGMTLEGWLERFVDQLDMGRHPTMEVKHGVRT